MTDTDKLKRLAERCTSGDPWYKEGDLMGQQTFGQFLPQDRAFIAAANPEAILALIAKNERLVDQYRLAMDRVEENGFAAEGLKQQRDEAVALLREFMNEGDTSSVYNDVRDFLARIDAKGSE